MNKFRTSPFTAPVCALRATNPSCPTLFTKASTATVEREKSRFTIEIFLCSKIMLMALDLASAVTTRLTAGGLRPLELFERKLLG